MLFESDEQSYASSDTYLGVLWFKFDVESNQLESAFESTIKCPDKN